MRRTEFLRALGGGAFVLAGGARLGDALGVTYAGVEPPPEHTVHSYVSRPDLRPPVVSVRHAGPVARGFLFLGPFHSPEQEGALMVDNSGNPVWFHRTAKAAVTNLRVAAYRGKPVLTWWEGATKQGLGEGAFVVADQTYREIARFDAAAGRPSDLHEMILTPRGTALVSSYETHPADLRAVGGPKDGQVVGGVVQELALPHGRRLFEWKSLEQVKIGEAHQKFAKGPYDYFHLNSVEPLPDGDVLLSGRNTWAVYLVDRGSGEVRWRLGGKKSDFSMGPGTRFAWQHDARWHDTGEVSLFDNGAAPRVHPQSRGLRLAVDTKRMRAKLVRAYTHAPSVLGIALGSVQRLPNGNWLVSWGTAPYFTEFGPRGDVRLDGALPEERWTYRTLRFPWIGKPTDDPAAVVRSEQLFVSWNGATEVATWELHAGRGAGSLARVATHPKHGFETALPLPATARYAAAVARDARGEKLGQSKTIRVS